MVNSDEHRSEQRLPRTDPITLDIVDCSNSGMVGQSLQCVTLDISATGLRVRTEQPLPVATLVEICTALHGMPGKFFLKGQVVHSSAAEEDGWFYHGIRLDDKPTADMLGWSALFDE
jgi:hypothetical protein